MNDTLFKNGGITDKNPKLLAILYDKDGINSTGSGIGHDISAVIDGDINKTIILNDYYRTFLNEYSYGYVEFPFTNLEAGKHSITITAYDIYNNPSEASIDFEVISDNNIAIKSVLNYPNPMKDYTTFVVEHNWAEKNVELELCIYNLSGNMITKMKYKGTLNGFNSHIFRWNRTTLDGKKAAEGIYIYNITLKGEDAEYAKSFGKLIIVH